MPHAAPATCANGRSPPVRQARAAESEITRPYKTGERTLSGWLEAAREKGPRRPAAVGDERETLAGLVAERNDATLAEYADLPAERAEAPVLRLRPTGRPLDYDPELLLLRDRTSRR